MKSIRLMLLAIFAVVFTVPMSFVATAPGGTSILTIIGIYGGFPLFIIGFIMSFFKSEEKDVEDKIKKEENKK